MQIQKRLLCHCWLPVVYLERFLDRSKRRCTSVAVCICIVCILCTVKKSAMKYGMQVRMHGVTCIYKFVSISRVIACLTNRCIGLVHFILFDRNAK